MNELKFEWDDEKDRINRVFTERKERIRLISARLATESERRLYYDQNIYN